MDDRLAIEIVALLFGATWVLVGVFGAVILRWEKTGVTEARRRELEEEREASERVSVRIRVWRVIVTAVLVGIPLLFAIDGLVFRLGILYAPSLTFSLGPDLALQIAGIMLLAAGLAVLIGLGRKLAVNRTKAPEGPESCWRGRASYWGAFGESRSACAIRGHR